MAAELAFHVPFGFWTLLCLGALVAFVRTTTRPHDDELETRGVFSTLSLRLSKAGSPERVRQALGAGLALGLPTTFAILRFVWRADPHGSLDGAHGTNWSTLAVIGSGWLLLSVGTITALALVLGAIFSARR